MPFDPCGTRKLEGDEILKRLAEHFGLPVEDLTNALLVAINHYTSHVKNNP
jgi:hypothetical protein